MIFHKKGFTLLELLVVIAVIGLLSAIIMAAVNSARIRGRDSAIISQIMSMRAQAELYYMANNKAYSTGGTDPSGMCGASPLGGNSNVFEMGTNNMSKIIDAIEIQIGITLHTGNSVCNANSNAWVAAFTLPGGGAYCVDSSGRGSGKTTTGTAYTTIGSAVSFGTFVCL